MSVHGTWHGYSRDADEQTEEWAADMRAEARDAAVSEADWEPEHEPDPGEVADWTEDGPTPIYDNDPPF